MDELTAGNPVTTHSVTLLPIERIFIQSGKMDSGYWMVVQKAPYAIILRDSKGMRAFDMEGNNISLQPLVQAVPDIEAILVSREDDDQSL